MNTDWIPYGRQSIDDSDVAAVAAVLRSDWLTTGPAVEAFETALARVTGAPTLVVSSGTAALHCAYAAAGIGRGDHVIVPAITFVATAAAAALLGAEVSVVDVTPDTLNIDPIATEAEIRPNTRAIVAVDFAGHPADLHELRGICDRHGLMLIEDASHSLGASLDGRPVGSIADLTTFSFHPVKPITTGEGGAVASPHPDLLERVRLFRNHGLVRDRSRMRKPDEGGWHQEVHDFGLNYRMPDINAALGVSQIERLGAFLASRRDLAAAYCDLLGPIKDIRLPTVRAGAESGWHIYVIRVEQGLRRKVYDHMRAASVGVQVHYVPIHLHPVFERLGMRGNAPVAEAAYQQILTLPLYPDLTTQQQEHVSLQLRQALSATTG